MSTEPLNLVLEGRIVNGHPVTRREVKKKLPGATVETTVLNADGTAVTEAYIAMAIPKTTADWKLSPWGQQIVGKATADWPNGEHRAPDFAWKVADGDSTIPNKRGNKPCDREGWPGHWIIHCSTRMPVKAYHKDKYDPLQQIQDANEVKTGDYGRLSVNVKGNGPSESPGIYVNPTLFSLDRAGQHIVTDSGPAASEVFGGGAPVQAPQAAPAPAAPPAAAVAPAPDFLNPAAPPAAVIKYQTADGNFFTKEQLLAAQYTEAMIAALPQQAG